MSDYTEGRLLYVLEKDSLAREIRKIEPDVQVERSALAIPQADRANNFTTGTMGLSIDGKAVAPAELVSASTATVVATYHVDQGLTGHVGYAHGGAIATVLDECCGRACSAYFQREKLSEALNSETSHLPELAAMTAQLSISYFAPIVIDSIAIIQAVVTGERRSGRKAVVEAKLWTVQQVVTGNTSPPTQAVCSSHQEYLGLAGENGRRVSAMVR